MKFERPGLGARVGQLGYLLKHTFTIVARDDDIIVPVLKMSAMAVIVVCLFFGGIAAVVLGNGGLGTRSRCPSTADVLHGVSAEHGHAIRAHL